MPQCCVSDECILHIPNVTCTNGMCQSPLAQPPFAACDNTACHNYCVSCQGMTTGACSFLVNECECS